MSQDFVQHSNEINNSHKAKVDNDSSLENKKEILKTQNSSFCQNVNLKDINPDFNRQDNNEMPPLNEKYIELPKQTDKEIIPEEEIPQTENANTEIEVKTTEEVKEFKVRTCNLIFMMINLAIGYFMFGYEVGVFNQIQLNIAHDLQWAKDDKKIYISVISVMIAVGAIFGSVVMGKVSYQTGRKWAYIINDIIMLVGIAITMIANTVSMIIGRFMCGFAVGGYTAIVPVFLKELVPANFKGYGSSIYNLEYNIGMLIAFSLGINIPSPDKDDFVWWRVVYAIPSVLVILNMIILLVVYKDDSPMHLYVLEDIEGAITAYKQVYEDEDEIREVIMMLEKDIKKKEAEQVDYKELCSGRFAQQIFIGIFLNIGLQCCCMNIFNYYSTSIFLKSISLNLATLFTSMLGVARLTGAVVSFFIFGKLAKKKVLLTGYSCICGCLFTTSLLDHFQTYEPIRYILLFHYFVFGSTIFTVYEIGPELLPDIGVGVVTLFHWVMNVFVTVSFPFLNASPMELKWTLMMYVGFLLVIILIFALLYKESTGIPLSKVEEIYRTWI